MKSTIVNMLAALTSILLMSCAGTGGNNPLQTLVQKPENLAKKGDTVKKGMTKEQVRAIMGNPRSSSSWNDTETWTYVATNQTETFLRGSAISMIPVPGVAVFSLLHAASTATHKQKANLTMVMFGHNDRVKSVNAHNSSS